MAKKNKLIKTSTSPIQKKTNIKYLSTLITTSVLIISIILSLIVSKYSTELGYKSTLPLLNEIKYVKTQKIYWSFANNSDYVLKEVHAVLESLGFEKGHKDCDWDLLWTFQWPFEVFKNELQNITKYQKVNHIPGTGVINTKVILATSGLEYIPAAFKLPEEKIKLLDYSKNNPKKSFVIKDNFHRKIRVAKINEIDLDQKNNFVQEFIDRPLLVDGYKFDIGLYTIITSIDPLRIYIYNGDIMLRFCPEKYYPFDSNNLDKYVIGDDYFPVWKIPGLDNYYNKLGFSKKETLNAYLQQNNINTKNIWDQAEDAIAKYILAKENDIIKALKEYPLKKSFFEMMRFDFVIDEDLKVHMLESNMSPNLSAEKHAVNKLLYHQILYNLFSLIGVGDPFNRTSFKPRSSYETNMMASEKNIVTFPNICNSNKCKISCVESNCKLCKPCLSAESKEFLLEAYREHTHKGDCKRIFPPTMTQYDALKGANLSELSPNNQIQYRWFEGKCIMDKSWC